ncbi:MAG TPA: hypothetical protein VH854_10535, partial [Thermoanaerobaculia bacterium]|nr:hypothetical protein [Thermoanaerobaculia bacterium]
MKSGSGRRRIRLFALLSGALILVSLVPLVVSEAVLIRRNRRTLETLEEKYLTRSSAAIADHIANYYDSAEQQLLKAVDVIQVAAHLTGKDPFNRNDAPEILKGALQVAGPLTALRAVNLQGQGSFVGPNVELPAIELEFRRGFESARDGARYVGSPFQAGDLGAVAVLAAPVEDAPGSRIGVVE